MLRTLFRAAAVITATGLANISVADGWTLDGDSSKLTFGSVKKDTVGETHHFSGLSGTVSKDGRAEIDIDLTSVETWIDIRNERMNEHVFGGAPTATLSAQLDMDTLNAMAEGTSEEAEISATLSSLGTDIPLDAYVFVTRLSDEAVMVTTDEILWITTEDLGINAGIDTLMALAKLPGITRTVPVTFRFMFNAGDQQGA